MKFSGTATDNCVALCHLIRTVTN